MARALWSGSISFGLVNVPVALFSAVRDQDVHFRQLHRKDGAPLEVRRFCSEEDKEIPWEAVGHGFETDGGEVVVLTDAELEAIAPRRTRTIEVSSFADAADIDPILYDHPYVVLPTGESEGPLRAYRLLVDVMAATDRVALGRVVMRTKEHLAAIRVRDGVLNLTTMRFHDEVRPTTGIGSGGKKPKKQELDHAVKLIEALAEDWDPSQYSDEHRKRMLEVVKEKEKKGKVTQPEEAEVPKASDDLLEALRASMEQLKVK